MPLLRRLADSYLWLQGTLVSKRQIEGRTWYTGRYAREQALIRRLLAAYPGLADQPPEKVHAVRDELLASLRTGRRKVIVFAVFFGTVTILRKLHALAVGHVDLYLPRLVVMLIAFAVASVAAEFARRYYLRADIDRVVARHFPSLFCPCGYSRIGLPADALCPECGHPPTPPPSPPSPSAAPR